MIVNVIVALIVCGVLLWAVMQLPLDPMIRTIIRVVVVVVLVLWLLRAFGLWHGGLP